MIEISKMRNLFISLWRDLNMTGDPVHHFQVMENAYGDNVHYDMKQRYYHTLDHIYWMLRRVDEMARFDQTSGAIHNKTDWDLIRFATWYHDLVMDDEEGSAYYAYKIFHYYSDENRLVAKKIERIICATKHQYLPVRFDEQVLCDCDLAILGSSEETFDNYENNIRKEYAEVSDRDFAIGRIKVLNKFLNRPWIYMTEYGRLHWELKARDNLKRSITKLKSLPSSDG